MRTILASGLAALVVSVGSPAHASNVGGCYTPTPPPGGSVSSVCVKRHHIIRVNRHGVWATIVVGRHHG